MAERYLTCPMCGYAFERGDTLCAHGCPLGSLCRLVRCPSCAYEFPEIPRAVSWARRVFQRRRSLPLADDASHALPKHVRTADELKSGERAKVLCLGASATDRHRTLTVFGVIPGVQIALIQRQPACVIQVGETELALDPEIARDILVEPLPEPEPVV